jgi:tetratricopeptide (TPR) repeat protein
MAPEGLQGNTGDHRSDIFSLGIVLHEALTGRIPYSSYEPTVLRREIIAGRQNCSADIPEQLRSICRKALSHSPHQRHPSAAQFAAELRQATRATPGRVVPWGLLLPIIGAVVLAVAVASAFQNKKPPTATLSAAELTAEAKNLFFQGKHEAAEAKLTEVLEQNPTNADALNKRGLCRLKRTAYKKSIEDFTAALDLTPNDPVLWKHRAMAYGSLREFEPAIRDFTKTLELDPNAKDARESFGATYSVMAAEKADAKQFQEAADLMDKAIAVYPEAAVFYHQRGSCFFHLGEYQKAIDDLNVAIGKEPTKPDHYENRALSLQRLGRHEEADADFEKAKELRNR